MNATNKAKGPDWGVNGIARSALEQGRSVADLAHCEPVLLVHRGEKCFAIGAGCSHDGAPLADGIVPGCTIRCPWHHARFDLATGETSGPPARDKGYLAGNASVAEQQGQAAARSMLGKGAPFDRAPFFWSAHYDLAIGCVGRDESWDHLNFSGDLALAGAAAAHRRAGRTLAVAAIGCDRLRLGAESALERGDEPELARPIPPSAAPDSP